jgi:hypothetical protein
MGVGERESGNGFGHFSGEEVPPAAQQYFNVSSSKQFNIAIESANVEVQATEQAASTLRANAQKLEQAIQPSRPFRGYGFECSGPMGRSALAWLPGHAVLGLAGHPVELWMILEEENDEIKTVTVSCQ